MRLKLWILDKNCIFIPSDPFRLVQVHNPNLAALKEDFFYHLNLGTGTHDLPAIFGDVKVIMLIILYHSFIKKNIFIFPCVFLLVCVCWWQCHKDESIH